MQTANPENAAKQTTKTEENLAGLTGREPVTLKSEDYASLPPTSVATLLHDDSSECLECNNIVSAPYGFRNLIEDDIFTFPKEVRDDLRYFRSFASSKEMKVPENCRHANEAWSTLALWQMATEIDDNVIPHEDGQVSCRILYELRTLRDELHSVAACGECMDVRRYISFLVRNQQSFYDVPLGTDDDMFSPNPDPVLRRGLLLRKYGISNMVRRRLLRVLVKVRPLTLSPQLMTNRERKAMICKVRNNMFIMDILKLRDGDLGISDGFLAEVYALRKWVAINGSFGEQDRIMDLINRNGGLKFWRDGQGLMEAQGGETSLMNWLVEFLKGLFSASRKTYSAITKVIKEIVGKCVGMIEAMVGLVTDKFGQFFNSMKDKLTHWMTEILIPEVNIVANKIEAYVSKFALCAVFVSLLAFMAGGVIATGFAYSAICLLSRGKGGSVALEAQSGNGQETPIGLLMAFVVGVIGVRGRDSKKIRETCLTLTALWAGGNVMSNTATASFALLPITVQKALASIFATQSYKARLEADEWRAKTQGLLNASRLPTVVSTTEYREAVEQSLRDGSVFLYDGRLDTSARMLLINSFQKLNNLNSILNQQKYTGATRKLPFGIHFAGEGGIGKSLVAVKFIEEAFGFLDTDIYQRSNVDDYWSGYFGQKVVMYDEFLVCSTDDALGKQAAEYLTLVSVNRFAPPMASIDSPTVGIKGTTAAPDLVVTVNNTAYNRPPQVNPDSFRRRRKFVIKMAASEDYKGDKNFVDLSQYKDGDIFDFKWVKFALLPGQKSRSEADEVWYDYKTTIQIVREAYNEHRVICDRLAKVLGVGKVVEKSPTEIISEIIRDTYGIPKKPVTLAKAVMSLAGPEEIEMVAQSETSGKTERPTHEHTCCGVKHGKIIKNFICKRCGRTTQCMLMPRVRNSITSENSDVSFVSSTSHTHTEQMHSNDFLDDLSEPKTVTERCTEYIRNSVEQYNMDYLARADTYLRARLPLFVKDENVQNNFIRGIKMGIVCVIGAYAVRRIFSSVSKDEAVEDLTFTAQSQRPNKTRETRKRRNVKFAPGYGFDAQGSVCEVVNLIFDGRHHCYGIPVKERKVLVFAHSLISDKGRYPLGTTVELSLNGERYAIKLSETNFTASFKLDQAIIDFAGTKVPQFKNNMNRFITSEELGDIDRFRVVLRSPEGPKFAEAKLGINQAYSGHGERFELEECWKYPISTSRGECGSPLIVNEGPLCGKIIGMHVAGSPKTAEMHNGASTLLFREDIEEMCANVLNVDEIRLAAKKWVEDFNVEIDTCSSILADRKEAVKACLKKGINELLDGLVMQGGDNDPKMDASALMESILRVEGLSKCEINAIMDAVFYLNKNRGKVYTDAFHDSYPVFVKNIDRMKGKQITEDQCEMIKKQFRDNYNHIVRQLDDAEYAEIAEAIMRQMKVRSTVIDKVCKELRKPGVSEKEKEIEEYLSNEIHVDWYAAKCAGRLFLRLKEDQDKYEYLASIVPHQKLEEVCERLKVPYLQPQSGEVLEEFARLPNCLRIEEVDKCEKLYLGRKTKFSPSSLYGLMDLKPTRTLPVLSKSDPRANGVDPVMNSIRNTLSTTQNIRVDEDICRSVEDSMVESYMENLKFVVGKRELTFEEACKGIPGVLSSIKIESSPGYPLVFERKKRGKTDFIWFDAEGEFCYDKDFKERVLEFHRKMNTGDTGFHTFVGYLKDELMSPAKIAEVRTRMIYANDLVALVAYRMRYGYMLAAFNNSFGCTSPAIGINQYSWDMERVWQYLEPSGDDLVDGDYKGFDQRVVGRVQWLVYSILKRIDEICGGNPIAFDSLIKHETQSAAQVEFLRFWTFFNHMSGCFWTTIFNCLLNEAYFRILFMERFPTEYFDECIRIVTLGDDHVVKINRKRIEWNPLMIKEDMKKLGQEYTSAIKGEELTEKYKNFNEILFLGAHPRIVGGSYSGAMKKTTLYDTVQYTRDKGLSLDQVVTQMIESASQWDEEFFESYKWQIMVNYNTNLPVFQRSWRELQRVVANRTSKTGYIYTGWCAQGPEMMDAQMESSAQSSASMGAGLSQIVAQRLIDPVNPVETAAELLASHALNDARAELTTGTDTFVKRLTAKWPVDAARNSTIAKIDVPWDLLALKDPNNLQNMPFRNHIYFASDVEVMVTMKADPYSSGMLIMYYIPLVRQGTKIKPMYPENKFACQHIKIIPNNSTTGLMRIPFMFQRSAMNTYASTDSHETLGTIFFDVVSPLKNTKEVKINVLSRFPGARFTIPRPPPKPAVDMTVQNWDYSELMEGQSEARWRRMLREVEEEVGEVMETQGNAYSNDKTYNIQNVVGDIPISNSEKTDMKTDQKLDMEMPPIPMDNTQVSGSALTVVQANQSMSKSCGMESVLAMQLHPTQMNREQNVIFDARDTHIAHLMKKQTMLGIIDWKIEADVDTILMQIPLNSTFGIKQGSPVPFNIALLNECLYWRATVVLDFVACRSAFQSGGIQVTVAYGAPSVTVDQIHIFKNTVLDFSGENSVGQVRIPYNAATEYLKTWEGDHVANPVQDYSMGHLIVTVSDPIITSEKLLLAGFEVVVLISFEDVQMVEVNYRKTICYDQVKTTNIIVANAPKGDEPDGEPTLKEAPPIGKVVIPKAPVALRKKRALFQRGVEDIEEEILEAQGPDEDSPTSVVELIEPTLADEPAGPPVILTELETTEKKAPLCKLDIGRKFEFTTQNIMEYSRRYSRIPYSNMRMKTTGFGWNGEPYITFATPVMPLGIWPRYYMGYAGHINYRIVKKTDALISVYYFPGDISLYERMGALILSDLYDKDTMIYKASVYPRDNFGIAIETDERAIPVEIMPAGGKGTTLTVSIPFTSHYNFGLVDDYSGFQSADWDRVSSGSLVIKVDQLAIEVGKPGCEPFDLYWKTGDDFTYGVFVPPLYSTFVTPQYEKKDTAKVQDSYVAGLVLHDMRPAPAPPVAQARNVVPTQKKTIKQHGRIVNAPLPPVIFANKQRGPEWEAQGGCSTTKEEMAKEEPRYADWLLPPPERRRPGESTGAWSRRLMNGLRASTRAGPNSRLDSENPSRVNTDRPIVMGDDCVMF